MFNEKRMNITGGNIKQFRELARLTQRELSAKLETKAIYICRGSISRIETGCRMISDIELQGIAEILHVPVSNLFHSHE